MTLFGSVVARLDREDVPFAVIGAGALAVHGIPRSTYDIDLLATSPRVLEERFWAAFDVPGATVAARHGDHGDPLRGVVRLQQPGQRDVDLIVGRHQWQNDVVGRAGRARVLGQDVPVATAADLILLKLYAGGYQDLWDIEQLLALSPDVRADVNGRIQALPAESQAQWADLLRGRAGRSGGL